MTLATKPAGVHNLSHSCQTITEPRPQETCAENFRKFGRAIFEICEQTDRHKDTETRPSQYRRQSAVIASLYLNTTRHAQPCAFAFSISPSRSCPTSTFGRGGEVINFVSWQSACNAQCHARLTTMEDLVDLKRRADYYTGSEAEIPEDLSKKVSK